MLAAHAMLHERCAFSTRLSSPLENFAGMLVRDPADVLARSRYGLARTNETRACGHLCMGGTMNDVNESNDTGNTAATEATPAAEATTARKAAAKRVVKRAVRKAVVKKAVRRAAVKKAVRRAA